MEEHATSTEPRIVKRIWPRRKNGLFNRDAPFWKGERAEDIVRVRVQSYKKVKARKKRT